jgi:aminotransferase
MLSLSKKAALVTQSDIRAMSIESDRIGGINLSQGVCDTEVPLPVLRDAQRAIEEGMNSYTRFDGLPELREAIALKMRDYNGIAADPETEITVSAGSTGAFYSACLAVLNPGDEVVVFEPYYGYHISTLLAVDAVPAYVTTHAPDWAFTQQDLESAVTSKTKGILVCTPSNPTGKVLTRAELTMIADFAASHDLFVFTDEIYEYFVYDGREHISIGSLPGMAERTITISGFSKTMSITGWRIGYSVSDSRWAQTIGYMSDLVYVCAPAPLQLGVARGMSELGPKYYTNLRASYTAKRDKICGALEIAGLAPYIPEGAYYILADVSKIPGSGSKEKAMNILSQVGVASVPGEAFYHEEGGANLVRFAFSKTDEDLDEACRRLQQLA